MAPAMRVFSQRNHAELTGRKAARIARVTAPWCSTEVHVTVLHTQQLFRQPGHQTAMLSALPPSVAAGMAGIRNTRREGE